MHSRVVDFHCNAFVEFCIQANKDEQKWLNKVFGNKRAKTRTEFKYDEKYDLIRFRVAKGDRTYGVGRYKAGDVYSIICRYPWTKRNDNSASLLTRDILTLIYDHLKNPVDMWAFMRVNKRFYQAGCFYAGYATKIEKLRLFAKVEKLPFESLSLRRRFFALCFVSCKKQEVLEKLIVKHFWTQEHLSAYCFNLVDTNGELVQSLDGVPLVCYNFGGLDIEKPLFGGTASEYILKSIRWCLI
jgi:hypothetical protein